MVRLSTLPSSQTNLTHSRYNLVVVFHSTPLAPADPIFALTAGYQADQFPQKVNLGVGAYRDDQGKPFVLPTVRKVRSLSLSTWSRAEGESNFLPLR